MQSFEKRSYANNSIKKSFKFLITLFTSVLTDSAYRVLCLQTKHYSGLFIKFYFIELKIINIS